MNNISKMVMINGVKKDNVENGRSEETERNYERYPMRNGYDDDASFRYHPSENRKRDKRGRYIEGPEMNWEPRYEDDDDGDDDIEMRMNDIRSPEARRADMHAVPREKIGFSSEHKPMKMDHNMAERWTKKMKNADGSTGAHWTMEQVKSVMAQHQVSGFQPAEFWAVMNSLYSDYCKVAKKFGVDRPDFYMELAKAWLNDEDAVDDKAAAYFEYIVK